MARDRVVKVTLKAQIADYLSGLQIASAATKKFAAESAVKGRRMSQQT